MSDILTDIGLDADILDILDDASAFAPTGRTFTLRNGVKVPFLGTINDTEYEAYALMHGGTSRRVSLIDHEVVRDKESRQSHIVSGVVRPLKMEITIVRNGTEISFAEFLLDIVNAPRIAKGVETYSLEDFSKRLGRMGLPIVNLPEYGYESSMPMLWQHFGPNMDAVNDLIDTFKAAGASDVLPPPDRRRRITQAWEASGFDIVEIEVGRSDRTATRYAGRPYTNDEGETVLFEGQGFKDFVCAVYENFERSLRLRTKLAAYKVQIKDLIAQASNTKGRERDALSARITELNESSSITQRQVTSWMANWGGAQQRPIAQPDGTLSFDTMFDAVSVPSGRQVLLVNGQEKEFDLWVNRNNTTTESANTDGNSESSSGSSTVVTTEEDPF